jgi:3-oxoacyl-[acyl-carrier-protein] synthase III
MYSGIEHISYYLPENILSNEQFFELFPELRSQENLKKIGVEERRISGDDEIASDMAVKAAKKLFADHNISPAEIDFLIYSSLDLDFYTPATSVYIHKELGLSENCGAIDTTHGCSAYVYGLMLAKGMIEANGFKKVLLLNAYTLTKTLHPKDRASRYVFGDGAAATLVVPTEKQGIGNCVVGTESKGWEKIILRHGGQRFPLNEHSYDEIKDEYGNVTCNANLYMDGTGVFLFSIRRVPLVVNDVLKKNQLTIEEIDLFIFHQANLYMISAIAKKVGIPPEKVFNNIHKIGNTVGSTIPIALAQATEQGVIRKDQKVMVIGFGVGLSWSATVLTI